MVSEPFGMDLDVLGPQHISPRQIEQGCVRCRVVFSYRSHWEPFSEEYEWTCWECQKLNDIIEELKSVPADHPERQTVLAMFDVVLSMIRMIRGFGYVGRRAW